MQDAETVKKNEKAPQDPSASAQQNDQTAPLEDVTAEGHAELIGKLESQLSEKSKLLTDTHDRMLRIAADFENARKRWERERQDVRQYSIQEFAKDLLPVVDAFEKALELLEEPKGLNENTNPPANPAMIEGLQLVSKIFYEALKKHGIERLPGKGSPFNPEFHNAIAKMVDPNLTQEIVIEEYTPGYRIADRILRTAMIRVGSPD